MRPILRIRRPIAAAAILAGALVMSQGAAVAASPPPNSSILFYKSGLAVTGTLKGGVFHQKRVLHMSGWTNAAVSRDTLLLYSRSTGKLKTGTFLNGIFTAKKTRMITTGWTTVIASCDSVLFYRRSTGAGFTATLKGGLMGTRHTLGLSSGWNLIDASCDTIGFLAVGTTSSTGVNGTLKGGRFVQSAGFAVGVYTHYVHTATSYLLYSRTNGSGIWGPAGAGTEGLSGSATGFSTFDLLAGTADSILFYRSDGLEARATLVNGVYAYTGGAADFSPGWTIIVGGR